MKFRDFKIVKFCGFSNLIFVLSIVLALFLALIIMGTDWPLGLSNEWVWARHKAPFSGTLLLFLCELPLIWATGGVVFWFSRRVKRLTPLVFGMIFLIVSAGALLNTAIWDAGRLGRSENVVAFLDIYTGGYLCEASNITNPNQFFSGYSTKMAAYADPSNHLDVHPPGNVFFSYLTLEFCRKFFQPRAVPRIFLSQSDRMHLQELEENGTFPSLPPDPYVYDTATLLLGLSNAAAVLGSFFVVISVIILRKKRLQDKNSADSTIKTIIWCAFLSAFACGAPALFTGHYDVFMYFLGALSSLTIVAMLCAEKQSHRLIYAAITGFVLAVAVSCTLAFGIMIVFAFAALVIGKYPRNDKIYCIVTLGGCGMLLVLFLWSFYEVNMLECVYYASRNNAEFFRKSGRSLIAWWPYNFFDLLIFGGPLMLALMFFALKLPFRRNGKLYFQRTPANIFAFLTLCSVIFLLTSSFSRGEMGRLLLSFLPCCLITAMLALTSRRFGNFHPIALMVAVSANLFLVFAIRTTLKLVITHGINPI